MTRERRYGSDTCFGDWIRSQEDIDSIIHAITVNDVDMTFHKYKTSIDAVGQRPVHLMMLVEVKCLGVMPNASQRQTLYFHHQLLNKKEALLDGMTRSGKRISVWHFGVFVLSLPKFWPEGEGVDWCSWSEGGMLVPRRIAVEELKAILRFDVRPDTMGELSLRRHHKTTELLVTETMPLGFDVEMPVIRRS